MFTSLTNSFNYACRNKIFSEMSNIDDLSRQPFSMPALGRHFDLGTVYDAIKDATIPGKY
jgi:hypothetical protein